MPSVRMDNAWKPILVHAFVVCGLGLKLRAKSFEFGQVGIDCESSRDRTSVSCGRKAKRPATASLTVGHGAVDTAESVVWEAVAKCAIQSASKNWTSDDGCKRSQAVVCRQSMQSVNKKPAANDVQTSMDRPDSHVFAGFSRSRHNSFPRSSVD